MAGNPFYGAAAGGGATALPSVVGGHPAIGVGVGVGDLTPGPLEAGVGGSGEQDEVVGGLGAGVGIEGRAGVGGGGEGLDEGTGSIHIRRG